MKKYLEFWGGIWERGHRTLEMPGTAKVKNALEKKVRSVKEVNIQGINERTEIMK